LAEQCKLLLFGVVSSLGIDKICFAQQAPVPANVDQLDALAGKHAPNQ
jgi:hypothetical protein